MANDQLARFVITPIGIAALVWSFMRIRRDFRRLGGLAGLATKLGYAAGKLYRRLAR
jgi:hypothetical protein